MERVTVKLPTELVEAARKAEGEDMSPTELVRRGLAKLAGVDPPVVRRGRPPGARDRQRRKGGRWPNSEAACA